jgi:hypothetical protein
VIEVDALDLRLASDDRRRFGWNHANTSLCLGESDFGIDVALDQGVVGKQFTHPGGAEGITE